METLTALLEAEDAIRAGVNDHGLILSFTVLPSGIAEAVYQYQDGKTQRFHVWTSKSTGNLLFTPATDKA
jgi:hypothetical protein